MGLMKMEEMRSKCFCVLLYYNNIVRVNKSTFHCQILFSDIFWE
jgi:hypothetical protein